MPKRKWSRKEANELWRFVVVDGGGQRYAGYCWCFDQADALLQAQACCEFLGFSSVLSVRVADESGRRLEAGERWLESSPPYRANNARE